MEHGSFSLVLNFPFSIFNYSLNCGMKGNLISAGKSCAFLGLALILGGCAAKLEGPVPDSGSADFTRTVAFGGSSMSGMKDGALYAEGQRTSIPMLVAKQLAMAGGNLLSQAEIPAGLSLGLNPYPWETPYQTKSQLGDRTDCNGEVSLGPVKTALTENDLSGTAIWDRHLGIIHDFTVPGAGLWDLDRKDLGDDHLTGGASVFASRLPFAGTNKSIFEAVVEMQPTFVIAWPGMDDMWNWASKGGTGTPMPSPAAFRSKLDSILSVLSAGGAKGVLATIPDVRDIPFFTTIPTRALVLDSANVHDLNTLYGTGGIDLEFEIGENGFVVEDSNSLYGIRQLTADEFLTLTVPLDSMKCFKMGVLFKMIPDRCSLIDRELQLLRSNIAGYNADIVDLAAQYDFAVADMAAYYTQVKSGIRFDAVDFTAEFASGGFFSLDGFGPNAKGAGLIANAFLDAVMAKYGAVLPKVAIDDLNGVLFP